MIPWCHLYHKFTFYGNHALVYSCRELQEEKESLEEELRKLKEQLTAHIEVCLV